MPDEDRGFVVYPANPHQIGELVESAVRLLKEKHGRFVVTWRENNIAGRFITEAVVEQIESSDFVLADVTRLNFNVAYEIGYTIGWGRRIVLVQNEALVNDAAAVKRVGIFDTLGYEKYSTSTELAEIVLRLVDRSAISVSADTNRSSPVYVLLPRKKTDDEVRLISRVKKARLPFRSFDPEEQGRLSAREAIQNVAQSHGVVLHLLDSNRVGATTHNLRAAFVAGLAHAQRKAMLLLQRGDNPVPLDYRDFVSSYRTPEQFNEYIGDFAAEVAGRLTTPGRSVVVEPTTLLAGLKLGASAAENELRELSSYYLETDEFHRALRGEAQIVTGRKGSGKTALFVRVRDRIRRDKRTLVLDLRPEGYQLLKFKEMVLDQMGEGTKEHTITAFWEYLLLLEMCHKLLENDRKTHIRNHQIFEPYRTLEKAYRKDAFILEADFAERLSKLMERINEDVRAAEANGVDLRRLTRDQVTELIYKHDVAKLREGLVQYLGLKNGVWILFDNLDKGWPPHGVEDSDLVTLRCLLDALGKLDRSLRKHDISCHGMVFIREDVYKLLIDNTPDRGKISKVSVDWSDEELLRELLRRRLQYSGGAGDASFLDLWRQICASHVEGEESSQYLIDRCLMRPRALIELVQACRSHAVNLGKDHMEVEDIHQGEEMYSTDLVIAISFEIRDVFPEAGDLLYEFVEAPVQLRQEDIDEILRSIEGANPDRLFNLLLWYGFLGLERDGEVTYVYSVKYDLKRLKALVRRRPAGEVVFRINPAFWKGLEIEHRPGRT